MGAKKMEDLTINDIRASINRLRERRRNLSIQIERSVSKKLKSGKGKELNLDLLTKAGILI